MKKSKLRWKSLLCVVLSLSVVCNLLLSLRADANNGVSNEPAKMIRIESDGASNATFSMAVQNLKPSTDYTISFQCKVEDGKFFNATGDQVYFRVRTKGISASAAPGAAIIAQSHVADTSSTAFKEKSVDQESYMRTYTFTTNDTDTTYGVGFDINTKTHFLMYIADFKLYESSDTEQKNLLPVDGDSEVLATAAGSRGLAGWSYEWPTLENYNETLTKLSPGSDSALYTAELMDYDSENVFIPNTPVESGPKMIRIESDGASNATFSMAVQNLKPNTDYTISFQCKVEDGKFFNATGDQVYFRVRTKGISASAAPGAAIIAQSHVADTSSTAFKEKSVDQESYMRTYTFTTNDTDTTYGVGFDINTKTHLLMYIADFKLYESSDAEQKNLLPVDGDSDVLATAAGSRGLAGWSYEYPTLENYNETLTKLSPGSDGILYTAELMDYDSEIFTNNKGDINGDTLIDIRDFVHLKKMISAQSNYKEDADLDNNGRLDAEDMVILRRYLLGKQI